MKKELVAWQQSVLAQLVRCGLPEAKPGEVIMESALVASRC